MNEPRPYKPTLFDRHGPDAAQYLRVAGFGIFVSGIALAAFVLQIGRPGLTIVLGCIGAGLLVVAVPLSISNGVGWTWKRFMLDGTSTPYVEQYSRQQALVMQGRVDEALASFEAIIAESAGLIDPRIRAAELYDREKKNFVRAASLFREVQRIDSVDAGQFIYVTNRLADLYNGPLNDRGKALVELRRLIERYPSSAAASHARAALAALKSASGVA